MTLTFLRFLIVFFILVSAQVRADCTSPAGVAGRLEFIGSDYKYCNGTDWISMIGVTGASCSVLGRMVLIGGVLSYCNGSNYISMVGTNTGGGCSDVGKLEYDSSTGRMNVCNGSNWMYFSSGSGGNPPATFSGHTFTSCGASGSLGPDLSACQTAYAGSNVIGNFSMSSQGIQEWTVPENGDYFIIAAGAGSKLGSGVTMAGTFTLTAGTILKIVVGQKGVDTSSDGGGGGGGSFVWESRPGSPLIVAGGAGGGKSSANINALTGANAASGTNCATSGTSGSGGAAVTGTYPGAGGAGWLGDGAQTTYSSSTLPGGNSNLFIGGRDPADTDVLEGGFGGGGAGIYPWGGGGGGGYSGGGGGKSNSLGGCGGGSFNSGTNQSNGMLNSGEGYISIYPFDSSADCSPMPGSTCTSGGVYVGTMHAAKYMVTPGGCTDTTTNPTCAGGTDTVARTWRGSTGTNQDIPGLDNVSATDLTLSSSLIGTAATPVIAAHSSISSNSAAHFCNDLIYGGFDDWYLPSKSELVDILCLSNATISSSSYPQEDPSCADRGGKKSILSGFKSARYWAASEFSSSSALTVDFSNGNINNYSKSSTNNIRCVRRFDVAPAPSVNPSGLSLTHTTRTNIVTLSWTSGGTGADRCVVQVQNGSSWKTVAPVNCNQPASNLSVTLKNLPANWGGVQLRLASHDGFYPLVNFPQTLNCTAIPASSSPTDTIDENCDGVFAGTAYPSAQRIPTSIVFGEAFSCPSSFNEYNAQVLQNVDFVFSNVRFYRYSVTGTRYTNNTCSTVSNPSDSGNVTRYEYTSSGTVPNSNTDTPPFNLENPGCQNHPTWGASFGFILSTVYTDWGGGECRYNSTQTYYD